MRSPFGIPFQAPLGALVLLLAAGETLAQCPVGYKADAKGICIAFRCATGQIYSGTACVAIQCLPTQTLVGNNCVGKTCQDGFSLVNGVCQRISCPPNLVIRGSDCDACPVGQKAANSTTCVPIVCPKAQVLDGSRCTCDKGFDVFNEQCVCNAPKVLNTKTGQCGCPGNKVISNQGLCVCPGDTVEGPNDMCSCQGDRLFNSKTQTCGCDGDKVPTSGNRCICPGYKIPFGNACMCPDGKVAVGTDCVCPVGMIPNNGGCACPEGRVASGSQCICKEGTTQVGNACLPCVKVGNSCVIPESQVKCRENEILDKGSCVPITCLSGQKLEGKVCTPITCAKGQRLSLGSCVPIQCPEGQSLDARDNCVPITCPDGYGLTGNDCIPLEGFKSATSLSIAQLDDLYNKVLTSSPAAVANSTKGKRATVASAALAKAKAKASADLVQLCNLKNNLLLVNKEILSGCLAGLAVFCRDRSPQGVRDCKEWYDRVFALSVYREVGAYCPNWKSGPKSKDCSKAVSTVCDNNKRSPPVCIFANYAKSSIFPNSALAP